MFVKNNIYSALYDNICASYNIGGPQICCSVDPIGLTVVKPGIYRQSDFDRNLHPSSHIYYTTYGTSSWGMKTK